MYRVMDVILKDVPTVSKFRLKLEHEYEDHQILDWLCAALMRGVMSLELVFSLNYASELFEIISGCATLNFFRIGKLDNSCSSIIFITKSQVSCNQTQSKYL